MTTRYTDHRRGRRRPVQSAAADRHDGDVQAACPRPTGRSLEALAERFHSAPELLQRLNPGARFEANEDDRGAERGRRWCSRSSGSSSIPRPSVARSGVPNAARSRPIAAASSTTPDIMARPDVVVSVSKAASRRDREGRQRTRGVLCPGDDRQRTRSAADRRMEGQRRRSSTRHSATTRSCSGMPIASHTKAVIPAGPEQSGRRRLDRPVEGALRHPRHARAVGDRPGRVARLRAADQLGRAESGRLRKTRHARGVHGVMG